MPPMFFDDWPGFARVVIVGTAAYVALVEGMTAFALLIGLQFGGPKSGIPVSRRRRGCCFRDRQVVQRRRPNGGPRRRQPRGPAPANLTVDMRLS